MKRAAAAVLAIALTSALTSAQATPPASVRQDIPVTAVALFSSGVGYFEHSGIVHGNGTTELRFRTSQMNDVLKSLVLQDEGGGHVTTVTYPSQDPLSKTLRSFQVDITGNPTVAELLNQLRGARVSVQSQGEHLSGTILGVESRRRQLADKSGEVDVPVLNLFSGAMIRSVELPSVTSLTFDDQQLQDELTKALAALGQARDQDKKPVVINFAGGGDRRVRVGYVVETPVWKTSYRLILDDKIARLQGWAMVENQTESDWNDVSLSLISGRPISFAMDLYSPQYLTRPTVLPPRFAELRPQLYEGGMASAAVTPAPAPGAGEAGRRQIGYDAQGRPDINRLSQVVVAGAGNGPIDAAQSVRSLANTAQLGELFEYTVRNVTLPRQKSAMIPIVAENVDVTRVSIYNASVLATNPLYGVRLKNTTGKSLLQGPVTVLESGGYAGDAQIDNLPAGQERLLSYGVDLQMLVNSTRNNQTPLRRSQVRFAAGVCGRQQVGQGEAAGRGASRAAGMVARRFTETTRDHGLDVSIRHSRAGKESDVADDHGAVGPNADDVAAEHGYHAAAHLQQDRRNSRRCPRRDRKGGATRGGRQRCRPSTRVAHKANCRHRHRAGAHS
jgi:hypothetical protein